MTMRRICLIILILQIVVQLVTCEIVPLSVVLDADSTVIHFVKGYLLAPAFVDIGKLTFIASEEPKFDDGDDDFFANQDDAYDDDEFVDAEGGDDEFADDDQFQGDDDGLDGVVHDDENNNDDGGGDRIRLLQDPELPEKSVVDIVLFHLPRYCAMSEDGCDWAALGVGAYDDEVDGGISYCCADDTLERKHCTKDQLGRLIVNETSFEGERGTIQIADTGIVVTALKDGKFDVEKDGYVVLVMANCNDDGRDVLVKGNMEWKAESGYLPGDCFGILYFYAILAIIYLVLLLFYGIGTSIYQDSAIPIQKYVMATIVLGLLELSCSALDLFLINMVGARNDFVYFAAVILGALKKGISRCLVVMVSMGWGVVRDTLGPTMYQIVILGLVYCGLAGTADVLDAVKLTVIDSFTIKEEEELLDVVQILDLLVVAVNIIFFLWILIALNATTEYLENMNQKSKLGRLIKLRNVVIFAIVLAVGGYFVNFALFSMSLANEGQRKKIDAGIMHANYLIVLVGVAILWRPNPNAKEYAYVMELPAMGGEDGENELELSCVVPSASDDGNDPDHPNGMKVDHTELS